MNADAQPALGGQRRPGMLAAQRILHRTLADDPAQDYFLYVPAVIRPGASLFVTVHGISRNAREQAAVFAPYCEQAGVVLVAPLFGAGTHSDYQRLGREGRSPRADQRLHAILEEVALLTGADASRVALFGYSGGAQFVHRYLMASPHRVMRAVVASAGWYTPPDRRNKFPYGIRRTRQLSGVRFDPEEFLRVPVLVLVGAEDLSTEGVRQGPRVEVQGSTRVERARYWFEAMQASARAYKMPSAVSLHLIPGGDHSFSRLVETAGLGALVFRFLLEGELPAGEEAA